MTNALHGPKWNSTERLLLLGALLGGFALRLFRLGIESLWYDETVSAYLAGLPPAEIVQRTAGDIHPPGYYLLLHLWQTAIGPSPAAGLEFQLAWPSLAWGLLTVAVLAILARRLFSTRVALLAAWLAAANPFHLWYSQEVRMYTQGALLGLLCIYLAAGWLSDGRPRRLLLYTVTGALGLYTLYYFAFLLAILALVVALAAVRNPQRGRSGARRLGVWLAAQAGVLVLYTPWLPILWRQATEPPVPPWRAPLQSLHEFAGVVAESTAVLLVGQTPPVPPVWIWALGAVLLVMLALGGSSLRGDKARTRRSGALLALVAGPVLLIYAVSMLITPLYHARYLFTYAAPFTIIVAVAVDESWRRRRAAGVLLLGLLLVLDGLALYTFWTAPAYRADDHRGAVQALARQWRPGDLILVNAGWVYPALATYWPDRATGWADAAVPPIETVMRLPDYADQLRALDAGGRNETVTVVRTGSVDGGDSLGWEDPKSDFFAQPSAGIRDDMAAVRDRHPRIWHYRLYDTVSDPDGLVRAALAEETVLAVDTPAAGRDFLRLQRFDVPSPNEVPGRNDLPAAIRFGEGLLLEAVLIPTETASGATLYVDATWRIPPAINGDALRTSLRLYDADGALIAQQDEPLTPPAMPVADEPLRTPLALPVPPATPPGPYGLELVVYRASDGAPLPPMPATGRFSPGAALGSMEMIATDVAPKSRSSLARFDYLTLVAAEPAAVTAAPGAALTYRLIWRPEPSSYSDDYTVVLEVRDDAGRVVQRHREALAAPGYPVSRWQTGLPVADRIVFSLAEEIAPGRYTLHLAIERSRDGLPIQAQTGWLPLDRASINLGPIEVAVPESGTRRTLKVRSHAQ